MFLINNKTYFCTEKELITIENTKEFITLTLNNLIETMTTGMPTMLKLGSSNTVFYFIIGFTDVFIISLSPKSLHVDSFDEDVSEFANEILSNKSNVLKSFQDDKETLNELTYLYRELEKTLQSSSEVFVTYDIRKRSLDCLIYSYENEKDYAIIYDQLDDLSETFRIVTANYTYLVEYSPVGLSVNLLDVGKLDFSKLIYKELKDDKNPFIKKGIKKLNRYIKKEEKNQ